MRALLPFPRIFVTKSTCVYIYIYMGAFIHIQLDIGPYTYTHIYRIFRDLMAIIQERVLQVVWSKTA